MHMMLACHGYVFLSNLKQESEFKTSIVLESNPKQSFGLKFERMIPSLLTNHESVIVSSFKTNLKPHVEIKAKRRR